MVTSSSNQFHQILTTLLLIVTTTSSVFFHTSTISDFPISVNIGLTQTTVTTQIPPSQQHLFHAIAFGNPQNTFGILQHPTTPLTFTFHQISSNSLNPNPYSTVSHWTPHIDTSNTHMTLTLTRPNNIGHPFYKFNPTQLSLPITYTYGTDTPLLPHKYTTEQLTHTPNTIRRLLPNTTAPTLAPTAPLPPTQTYTNSTAIPITTAPVFAEGIEGYVQRGKYWINNDASQLQLLIICAVFSALLILCLCCCYVYQARKTKKLRQTLFQFQPDLIQNERKKKNKHNNDDIPYVDAADPDSSLGDHDSHVVAPAADENGIMEEAPDDNEANYRKHRRIPSEIENKLEESLSVDTMDMNMPGMVIQPAPPPPSEPVPKDILQQHRQRAATQLQQKQRNASRRNTYHPQGNGQRQQQHSLELAPMQKKELERVRTQSHMGGDSDPPTPVSDQHNGDIMIEEKYNKRDSGGRSLQNIANKRLSKRNNDPALALLSEEFISAPMQKEKVNVNINNNENDGSIDEFDVLSSPSAEKLFGAESIDNKNDPFSSVEHSEPKPKAQQSGNDIILGMLGDEGNYPNEESISISIEEAVVPIAKPEEIGNNAVLDMLNHEPEMSVSKDISKTETDIIAQVNETDIGLKESKPSHRGKQIEDDPFASLDMSPTDLFAVNVIAKAEKKEEISIEKKEEIDSEAMGVLGGLLSANPEFGDNNNIFGGSADNATDAILNSNGATSNIIDFDKYAQVQEIVPVDYDKLTKISDTDQYKVVSVQETVTVDDGDGNVQQMTDEKVNDLDDTTELENILQNNMENATDNNVEIIAEDMEDNSPLDALIAAVDEKQNIVANDDPFSPMNDDPFAALAVSSPLDNIVQTSAVENDANSSSHDEMNDFAALNASSPLDNIMQASVEENDANMEYNNDAFAELAVSSPLDNIMQASADNEAETNMDTFDNMASPLDNIMQASADENDENDANMQNNNDAFADMSSPLDNIMNAAAEENEVNNDAFADMSSPLDNIMSAANENENETEIDPFAAMNVSPLDAMMNEAAQSSEEEMQMTDNDIDPFASLNPSSPLDVMNNMNPGISAQTDATDQSIEQLLGGNNMSGGGPKMGHQTIDIDNYMQSERKEEDIIREEEQNEEESMGSEIIHETPRQSAVMREQLNPEIFGDDNGDESTSEESDGYGTDPN